MSEKNKNDNLDEFELNSNSEEEFEFEDSKENKDDDFELDFEESKDKSNDLEDFDIEDSKSITQSKDDDFDFDIDEEPKVVSQSKDDDFDFDIEEEPKVVSQSKDDDFDFDIEEEPKVVSQSKDDDFDFDIEEEPKVVSQSKDDDFDFDIEEEPKVVSQSKDDDFDFDIEEEPKIISQSKDDNFNFDIEEDEKSPIKSKDKDKDFDFEEIEEDFFENSKEIVVPEISTKNVKINKKENNESPLNIDELFSDNSKEKDTSFDIDSFIKNDNSNQEFSSKKDVKKSIKVNNEESEDEIKVEVNLKDNLKKSENFTEVKNNKSFNLTKMFVSFVAILTISSVGYIGYINKDGLSNLVENRNIIDTEEFRNKTIEIANEVAESRTNEYKLKLENALTQLDKLSNEQSNLIKENLNLKEQIESVKNTQANTNTSNIEMQIATFSEKINSMEMQQDENKELLKKAVNATLSLIRENQSLDKNLEDKVYQKVYSEFEKIFNSQRFRLNDLSIIESKMNENVQIINQIKQDLRQYKTENDNLKSKIKLLENNDKSTTSIIIDKKAKNEVKKQVSDNRVTDKKEVRQVKSLDQNNFKIQGIIDSNIAYIIVKGVNNSKAKAYTIGDNVPNCGKITKITENTVVCTGGTLKYN